MRLRRLELRNFRRYQEASLDFPDGVLGLVGRNGAGKSTLVEAVTWALFGHEAARTRRDLIKHSSAAPGDPCEVALEFDLDGEAYRVVRRMRGASLAIEVEIDAGNRRLVAGGSNSSAEGTAYIRRLLGFDKESFLASVVARQGELSALSGLTPAKRKQVLMQMLGVDALEDAIRLAREEARVEAARLEHVSRARGQLKEVRARAADLEGRRREAERQLKGLADEVAKAEEARAALEARAAQAAALRERINAVSERAQEARQRQSELESRRAQVRKELSAAQGAAAEAARLAPALERWQEASRQLEELAGVREAWQRAHDLTRRAKGLRAQAQTLRKRASDLPVTRKRLEATAKELETAKAKLGAARDEATSKVAEAASALSRAEAARQALDALVAAHERVSELGPEADCPVCLRRLDDAYSSLVSQHEQERERLMREVRTTAAAVQDAHQAQLGAEAKVKALVKRVEALESESSSLTRSHDEAARAEHQAKQLDEEAAELEASLDAGAPSFDEPTYERLRKEVADGRGLEAQHARAAERGARVGELEGELEAVGAAEREAGRAWSEAESTRLELEGQVAQLADAESKAKEAARGVAALTERRGELQGQVKQGKEEAARLADERARLEQVVAEGDQVRARVKVLEVLAEPRGEKGLLSRFKTHVIARIRPALEAAASRLLAQMTDGRYVELSLTEDYDVEVYDGQERHPLARFSGGEVDVVNLAIRLAINELISQVRGRSRLGFVALDEVFGSQDAERRYHVLSALKGLRSTFPQVLVISHHEEVQERLEHVVRVSTNGARGSVLAPTWLDNV